MKKILIPILLLLTLACAPLTINAQSFPINIVVEWSPNPLEDAVISYNVYVNESAPQNVLATSCTSTVCSSQPIAITGQGNYTFSVRAINQWGTSDPGSVSVRISVPGRSGNVQIRKQ